jgi:23S rRNA (guanosine2251-2'-O)-methyltransferase
MPKQKLIVVLHNIRSRENVGSIFRTADAAGVSKLYLCGITPTPPHDKISRTALGSETYVPWESYKQAWRLLAKLKEEGMGIIALELTKDSEDIFKFKPKYDTVLVLGNEVKGLSPQILKYCDKKLSIPMRGQKESLNVAVAFGIAAYQLNK